MRTFTPLGWLIIVSTVVVALCAECAVLLHFN